ncbi:hypothetical protein ACRAWG_36190 [Methylobacterium sp. P31]
MPEWRLRPLDPQSVRGLEPTDDLGDHAAMCNLYSLICPQSEIGWALAAEHDNTGNLPPLPGIFPNTAAPVVRMRDGAYTLSMMCWGMPAPVFALKGPRPTD